MTRDYVDERLPSPRLDRLFPHMVEVDKNTSTWPWLRRDVDHTFRVDRRNPIVGFINRDEASILFGNARLFAGRRGLEIGAWRGWSTAHLIAAKLASLHVVEPLLEDQQWRAEFLEVVRGGGGEETTILVPERSPEAVVKLGQSGVRWSFAFIDGDHDGQAPARDARACEPFLEDNAMVLFHDLVSPYVAKGLRVFEQQGWNIMAYQTAQIVGVAWRGKIAPVVHRPDPVQAWTVPAHLKDIAIFGV